jgi:putative transposase
MPEATKFQVSRTLAGSIAYLEGDDRLLIFDAQGTLLAEYPWPEPGTKYVGSGNPRGPRGPRKPNRPSEMS